MYKRYKHEAAIMDRPHFEELPVLFGKYCTVIVLVMDGKLDL